MIRLSWWDLGKKNIEVKGHFPHIIPKVLWYYIIRNTFGLVSGSCKKLPEPSEFPEWWNYLCYSSVQKFPEWWNYLCYSSVQFSPVAQSCLTVCDPMDCSTPGLPVHHQLPEFTQTCVHWVHDAIQPSHPLSSPSPPAPNPSQHQSLFQWVNSSHEVAKVQKFQH